MVAAFALVYLTNRAHTRNHDASITARADAAHQCVEALDVAGEAFAAGTATVAQMAGAVVDAGAKVKLHEVDGAINAVIAAQEPAQDPLAECVANDAAPTECSDVASAVQEVVAGQTAEAVTLGEIAQAAVDKDRKGLDAALATLSAQQSDLQVAVAAIDDAACRSLGAL